SSLRGTRQDLPRTSTDTTRTTQPKNKVKSTSRAFIYAKRRNGDHPRAKKASLTRPRSRRHATLPQRSKAKVKGHNPQLSGWGAPTLIVKRKAAASPPPPAQRQGKTRARRSAPALPPRKPAPRRPARHQRQNTRPASPQPVSGVRQKSEQAPQGNGHQGT